MTSPWLADPNAPATPHRGPKGERLSVEILMLIHRRFPALDADVMATIWSELVLTLTGIFAVWPIEPEARDGLLKDVCEQVKLKCDEFEEFAKGRDL